MSEYPLSEAFGIGDIKAARGEKKTGYVKVGETAVATINIPLAIVNGVKPGPVLCLSGGVHGAEYSSIEAVIRVLRQLDPSKLSGTLLIVPVLNMTAFETRGAQGGMSTPFQCPIDGMNLNRIFPGNPEGSMSYQIAAAFMSQIVSKADYYIDCHGGDLNEELTSYIVAAESGDAEKDRITKEVLAASFDCDVLSITHTRGGSIEAAAKMGKPCIIIEAGGYGRLIEETVQLIVNGITNVMKRLQMIEGSPSPRRKQKIRQRWNVYVTRGGICYTPPLATRVKKGDKVVEVRNIFGELLETVNSPIDGVIDFRRSLIPINTNDRAVGITPDEDIPPPKPRPYP
jgi:predicted deacylase